MPVESQSSRLISSTGFTVLTLPRAPRIFDSASIHSCGPAPARRRAENARFLALVRASGVSSMDLLQNIYPSGDPSERSLSLALALCRRLLERDGAWRVHGGGFAGTVQAFVPMGQLEDFRRQMEAVFGPGTCHDLSVRPAGGIQVTAEGEA